MKAALETDAVAAADIKLTEELTRWRLVLDQAMAEFFNSKDANGGLPLGRDEHEAYEILAEFSSRPGKRIRGGLAMFAYEKLGGTKVETGLKLAVAIELIQNYFLIVDDVMDRSSKRRGKPTVHKIFRRNLSEKLSKEESEHLGDMLAINIGLVAQHLASRLLSEVDEEPARVVHASQLFQKNILGTCYGQIGDIYSSINRSANKNDLIRVHTLKNSYYTFINPLQVAAVLAGKSDKQTLEHLAAIGAPAGVAFQLQDDILGLFGDEKLTGKPSLDDLREGKFTLMMSYAFAKASKAESKMLQSALGNPRLDVKLANKVRHIVEKTGAREACESLAEKFCLDAQDEIAGSQLFDRSSRDFLIDLINYSASRKA